MKDEGGSWKVRRLKSWKAGRLKILAGLGTQG
jgi:hypothetical protein